MKKLLILIICFQISLMPLFCINEFSFAESGGGGASGDAWLAVNDEASMVAAFKAYCRSRNLNKKFTFSNGTPSDLAKAIINYNYDDLEKACALAGTDIDTVSAGLWYKIDNNNILKFFYNSSAMSLLNQLYSALLTEHGIQENTQNNLLYSGEYFQDSDGEGAFVYYATSIGEGFDFTKVGTIYRVTGVEMKNSMSNGEYKTYTFNINNANKEIQVRRYIYQGLDQVYLRNTNAGFTYNNGDGTYYNNTNIRGGFAIIKTNSTYYLGTACNYKEFRKADSRTLYKYTGATNNNLGSLDLPSANIKADQGEFNTPPENKSMEVQTDSDTINNYITNNDSHDTYNYYDDDDPPSPPPYTNPFDNNPTGGTIGDDGSINFQMPDLNIDWNLGLNVEDLPFPFSIPFDFNNALKMLDVEPETPRFQGTITIPYINYDWEIDLDFGEYDEYETLINMFQKVFLFGYVISLILATRAVMHIY